MPLYILLLASGLTAHASENLCKPDIKPASGSELAYKQRGDRCEGLFAQKVSATGLRIAAFHKHPARYDDSSASINISSAYTGSDKVLTVTSLRPKQFYRMDTVHAGTNFALSPDVVRHPEVNVAPSDFAALVCTQNCDTSIPTLVPAWFDSDEPHNPYVALVANLELFELRISIRDAETDQVLFDEEVLGKRTWPAGRPATFPLKPYLSDRDSIVFDVVGLGRGNKLIDSISARLEGE